MSSRRNTAESRVVVTGMGTVCPLGNNWRDAWKAMAEGRSGIARLTQFDVSQFEVQIGGEVKDFRPEETIPTKELRRMDKNGQFAVVSALEAVSDAALVIDDTNRDDVGVIFGSAGGGYGLLLEQNEIFLKSGYRRVSPFLISNILPDAASGHVAIATGACGPNMAIASACSTGTGAIGEAWETIRRGDAEAIIAGGTDNPLLPVLLAGFHALRALANDAEHPERANKPFDANRDGFVVGRGAAALVLESLDHAQARAAPGVRRGHRLRDERRRVRHGGFAGERALIGAGDDAGDAQGRYRSCGGAVHQPARHGHAAERPRRDGRDQGGVRPARVPARGQLDEVDARPPDGRGGRAGGDRLGAGVPDRHHPPNDQLRGARPRLRPRLRAERRAHDVGCRCPNSVSLGSHNACVIFRRLRLGQQTATTDNKTGRAFCCLLYAVCLPVWSRSRLREEHRCR
jgi:hypothetical protein